MKRRRQRERNGKRKKIHVKSILNKRDWEKGRTGTKETY